MATKKPAKSGLGEPDIQGTDALFNMLEPETPEEEVVKVDEAEAETSEKHDKDKRPKKQMSKTSLYLSEETLDQLHDLKKAAKKQEGRFVPAGELIEWAVKDLAKKML